jgi:hypothetical protein
MKCETARRLMTCPRLITLAEAASTVGHFYGCPGCQEFWDRLKVKLGYVHTPRRQRAGKELADKIEGDPEARSAAQEQYDLARGDYGND